MSADQNATIATETPPGAHGCSLQHLVRRPCETCKHWSFREWVMPERGVCWMHYGIAKAADDGCDRWNSEARHSPPIERMAFSRV